MCAPTRNLFTPELAVRGTQLSSGPVAGVNQFYIVETRYRETAAGDDHADAAARQLRRPRRLDAGAAEPHLRCRAAGARRLPRRWQPRLECDGARAVAPFRTRARARSCEIAVAFPYPLSNTPSAITLTSTTTSNVSGSASVTGITQDRIHAALDGQRRWRHDLARQLHNGGGVMMVAEIAQPAQPCNLPLDEILLGDALATLRTLPSESVHCIITSPPYWQLRDYGIPGQLGLEVTIEEYVANMVTVFAEVRRVLRRDGTLWLNLGDTSVGKNLCLVPRGWRWRCKPMAGICARRTSGTSPTRCRRACIDHTSSRARNGLPADEEPALLLRRRRDTGARALRYPSGSRWLGHWQRRAWLYPS